MSMDKSVNLLVHVMLCAGVCDADDSVDALVCVMLQDDFLKISF